MRILKLIYSSKSIKRKVLNIVDDLKISINAAYKEIFWIDYYGAYDIDPKYLAIWICVKSDKTKLSLLSNQQIMNSLKEVLIKHDYPKEAIDLVHIGIESQETVERESDGNWYNHFK